MATRSDFMIYNDQKIRIASFAPMGSAVCFPVETLIFWALSIASLRYVGYHSKSGRGSSRTYARQASDSELAREIAVFGDDIIIPNIALPTLISVLSSIGCSPNLSKTCWKTPFRESCGSEWYKDIDVSIIRNRQYKYVRGNISNYPVLLDMQRKFFLRGYFRTASLLRDWAEELFPVIELSIDRVFTPSQLGMYIGKRWRADMAIEAISYLTFFDRQRIPSDKFPCAFSFYNSYPEKLKTRFNRHYHRYEARIPISYRASRSWALEGYPRLMARLLSDSTDRIAIRVNKTKMAWSFFPGFGTFMPNCD
jgi:hypothetical protein